MEGANTAKYSRNFLEVAESLRLEMSRLSQSQRMIIAGEIERIKDREKTLREIERDEFSRIPLSIET